MVWASAEDILTSRAHTKFTTKNTRLMNRKSRYSGSLRVGNGKHISPKNCFRPNFSCFFHYFSEDSSCIFCQIRKKWFNGKWNLILPVSQKLWCIFRLRLENNLRTEIKSCIMQMCHAISVANFHFCVLSAEQQAFLLKQEPCSWKTAVLDTWWSHSTGPHVMLCASLSTHNCDSKQHKRITLKINCR